MIHREDPAAARPQDACGLGHHPGGFGDERHCAKRRERDVEALVGKGQRLRGRLNERYGRFVESLHGGEPVREHLLRQIESDGAGTSGDEPP
ncbi:Uncharacterised protein [Mycobacteroides abscessus subsp. abscessus]|nr:Uncharacterised protein [Mycobacteroides abscessus subsp. abscessus]